MKKSAHELYGKKFHQDIRTTPIGTNFENNEAGSVSHIDNTSAIHILDNNKLPVSADFTE